MRKKYSITAKTYDKRGRLIASAENNYRKTHPLMLHFASKVGMCEKIYLHAEVLALIRSGEREVDHMVIERYNSDGSPALAKPCPVCTEAIKAFGVKQIFYTKEYEHEEVS